MSLQVCLRTTWIFRSAGDSSISEKNKSKAKHHVIYYRGAFYRMSAEQLNEWSEICASYPNQWLEERIEEMLTLWQIAPEKSYIGLLD